MQTFLEEYANQRLWIACSERKTPLAKHLNMGDCSNPVFTLEQVPTEYLRGFVLQATSGLVFIDLDRHVLEDGSLDEIASDIISRLPTDAYIAYSKSGKGLHIVGKYFDTGLKWANDSHGVGIEIYTRNHYMIYTGNFFGESKGVLYDLTPLVQFITDKYLQKKSSSSISITTKPIADENTLSLVKKALAKLDPDSSREDWSKWGLAIGNDFKDTPLRQAALSAFVTFSKQSKKFDANAINSIKDFFNPERPANGLTCGSIFYEVPKVLHESKLELLCDNPEVPVLIDDSSGDELDAGGSSDTEKKSDDKKFGKWSFKLHPNKVAHEFVKALHCFTEEAKKFTLWHSGKLYWELDRGQIYILKQLTKFIFDNKYNWIVGRGEEGRQKLVQHLPSKDLFEVFKSVEQEATPQDRLDLRPNCFFDTAKRIDNPYVIPVQNGLFSITKNSIIGERTPEFYNTGVLPFKYDPGAVCPMFLEGLKLTFAHEQTDDEVQDNIDCLQLWFGYLFLTGYSEKKICVLLGDSDSGKSTLLKIMETLVGKQYYKALELKDLDGSRTESGVGFDTNFLGGFDEFEFDKKLSSLVAKLKAYSGDARISQRKLHKESTTVEMNMRLVLTSNTEPTYFSDPKNGLMNRLLIWYCKAIPRGQLNPNYLRELEQKELPGIFNWAVEGARKVLGGSKLRQPTGESALIQQEFVDSSKTYLDHWVEEVFIASEEGRVSNKQLYDKLIIDRCNPEFRSLSNWLDREGHAKKTMISKIIQSCFKMFPNAVKFKSNDVKGLKGIEVIKRNQRDKL